MKTKIPITLHQNIQKPEPEIKEVNLVQDKIIHPELWVVCTKHCERTRGPIKHASLEGPKATLYKIAQYKYLHPDTGKTCYYTPPVPGVTGMKRHDTQSILRTVQPVIMDEMTNSAAAHQGRSTFNLTTVAGTIYKWVNQIEIDQDAFDQVQQEVIRRCSGHLSIDEVYDDEGTIITTDPVEDTILHITTHKEEITNETVEDHLEDLKAMGIEPDSFTKDGSPLYVNTIRNIFGALVLLQTCLFHLIKGCIKEFSKWMKAIRDEIEIPKMKRGRKKNSDSTHPCGNPYKKLKQKLFRLRFLILRLKVSPEERKTLREVFEQFPALKEVRGCFLLLKRLLESTTLEEAEHRYQSFIQNPVIQKNVPGVIKKLRLAYSRNELFSYLTFDKKQHKKIRTTNHTERTNRKFRKKQKTHYRIRKYANKVRMLRLMQYFHNYRSLYGKDVDIVVVVVSIYFFCMLWNMLTLHQNAAYSLRKNNS